MTPDDELREDIASVLALRMDREAALLAATIILQLLRRRGAWLPRDPVTDEMVHTFQGAMRGRYYDDFEDQRAMIAAALAARAKP
jgi:hypothetical protein